MLGLLKKMGVKGVLWVVGVALFLFVCFCTTKIDAGYGGVVYSMNGGVEDDALSQGWHVVSPFKTITEYPISTETVYLSRDKKEGSSDDDSFFISTKDGKNVNVDVSYSYRMDFERLSYDICEAIGEYV